jgi:hypothetical protein
MNGANEWFGDPAHIVATAIRSSSRAGMTIHAKLRFAYPPIPGLAIPKLLISMSITQCGALFPGMCALPALSAQSGVNGFR